MHRMTLMRRNGSLMQLLRPAAITVAPPSALRPSLLPSSSPLARLHARPAGLGPALHRSAGMRGNRIPPSVAASAGTEMAAPVVLYNTLTRRKEAFTLREDQGNKVNMYVCGVTVYDYSHIGHARVYVAFDILYRYLTHAGYDVTYCRNFTDIDDKIINRARESGEDPLALSRRFIEEFHVDMEKLRCLRPQLEPKATDFVPQMVDTIQRIIQNGHAYTTPGSEPGTSDVYFHVPSFPGYGQLSGRAGSDNRAGERVAVDDRKKDPSDFALWKSAKAGEPTWDSPWGPGRPGWHIECSSMIETLLGDVIDIHGGGRDLIFPHHENELAQSRAAAGPCGCGADHSNGHSHSGEGEAASASAPSPPPGLARYWVHNGFVTVDSEKMSKSLGNFFTIRDVLKAYHPMALRWFLVGTQYRQPINYSTKALDDASDRLYYALQTILDVRDALTPPSGAAAGPDSDLDKARADLAAGKGPAADLVKEVTASLSDDLNTPQALSALSGPFKTINELLTTKAGKKRADRRYVLHSLSLGIEQVLSLLGFDVSDISATLAELRGAALVRAGVDEAWVSARIEERKEARAAKDFARADQVRTVLAAKGITLMDVAGGGTTWRPVPVVDAAPAAEAKA